MGHILGLGEVLDLDNVRRSFVSLEDRTQRQVLRAREDLGEGGVSFGVPPIGTDVRAGDENVGAAVIARAHDPADHASFGTVVDDVDRGISLTEADAQLVVVTVAEVQVAVVLEGPEHGLGDGGAGILVIERRRTAGLGNRYAHPKHARAEGRAQPSGPWHIGFVVQFWLIVVHGHLFPPGRTASTRYRFEVDLGRLPAEAVPLADQEVECKASARWECESVGIRMWVGPGLWTPGHRLGG